MDLIAQEPVAVRMDSDTPGYAQFVADRNGFDILPLEENGRIVRYVRREELERHGGDEISDIRSWQEIQTELIHPDEIVSASSPLLDLLDRFSEERPLLFVLGPKMVQSVVTIYDLNQPAAHLFGFGLCLVVEAALARRIEAAALGEAQLALLSRQSADESPLQEPTDRDVDDEINAAVGRLPRECYGGAQKRAEAWRKKADAGEQVRLVQELVFHDKIGLIEQSGLADVIAGRCASLPAPTGTELLRVLNDDVRRLRNAVAHTDNDELADEHQVWRWMRTALHLAQDLSVTS